MKRSAALLVLCVSAGACATLRTAVAPAGSGTATASGTAAAPANSQPAPPPIPRDAARFEIESVDDSTARFRVHEVRWLHPGMTVYAVDAARRDALVARLRVIRADSGRLTAMITSQVTRVTADHFVLAVRPPLPWYREKRYWWGVLAGGAVMAAGIGATR